MDGYDVEELYYLYLQDCPEAKRYLMKFCYKQIEIILPKYYISTIYKDEYEDRMEKLKNVNKDLDEKINNSTFPADICKQCLYKLGL